MTRHVHTDPKTGRLSYRRAYPADLRPYVPRSPLELKRSLRARSLSDPAAMRRYADAQAEYERTIAAARLKASGSTRPLAEADIAFLVATYAFRLRKNLHDTHWDETDAFRHWLTASAWRYAPFGFMDTAGAELAGSDAPWTNSQRIREALPALIRHWRAIKADGVREALIQAEGQTAEELCHENGLSFDQGSSAFFSLCRGLLDADMDTAHRLARMVDPEDATPIDVPEAPIAPQPAPKPLGASQRASEGAGKAGAAIPLMDLYEGYVQVQGVSVGVRREWRNNLLRLVDFLGHDDAARITREDITRWRADLLASPAKGGKLVASVKVV